MLFLSPGTDSWLQTFLHWCDNNAVFIVDVSRVHANSFSEDGQETKSKRSHILHFRNFSEWHANKRIKTALEIPTFKTISQVLTITAYLWLNTNH